MAFSTGVSLLTAGNNVLRNKIYAWSQMDSGTTFVNAVTGNTFINSVSGLQSSSSPVGALGFYYVETFNATVGEVEHTVVETDISALRNTDYVFGFWLKVSSTATNFADLTDNLLLLFGEDQASGTSSYDILMDGIGIKAGRFVLFEGGFGYRDVAAIPNTNWNFICVRRKQSSNNCDVYINNSLVGSNITVDGFFGNVGRTRFCSKYFEVTDATDSNRTISMDSFFLGSGAITSDDLTYLYNAGAGRNYSDLPLF